MDQPSTSWGDHTLSILKSAGVGVLSFVIVFIVNLFVGLAVTAAIVIGAWSDPVIASVLGLVAFIAMITASTILSFKRSISVACVHALRTTAIAPITINFIFKGLVPDADEAHGDRGHIGTLASERLPLRQCEDALKARIQDLLSQSHGKTGLRAWFMRMIQALLLKTISKITLAELRRQDSTHGGVDLHKVREKLIQEAQTTLPDHLESKLRIVTILAITLPPILATSAALITYWLLVRYIGV